MLVGRFGGFPWRVCVYPSRTIRKEVVTLVCFSVCCTQQRAGAGCTAVKKLWFRFTTVHIMFLLVMVHLHDLYHGS